MKILIFCVFLTLFASGCATHATMRGGVAMKVSDTQAHVCLGEGEVKVGDRVTVYYNDCQDREVISTNKGGAYGVPCVKKRLGTGTITKVLNAHYSVVEFDEGIKFTEGTFVEKQN